MGSIEWSRYTPEALATIAAALAWWRSAVKQRRAALSALPIPPRRVWLVAVNIDGSTSPPRPYWLHWMDPTPGVFRPPPQPESHLGRSD